MAATVVSPCAARGDAGGHVGARQFGDALGLTQRLQLISFQPYVQLAVDHGNGGRGGACVADVLFHLCRNFDVLGVGHAVGDDGAFQCHDGAARVFGSADFG